MFPILVYQMGLCIFLKLNSFSIARGICLLFPLSVTVTVSLTPTRHKLIKKLLGIVFYFFKGFPN